MLQNSLNQFSKGRTVLFIVVDGGALPYVYVQARDGCVEITLYALLRHNTNVSLQTP